MKPQPAAGALIDGLETAGIPYETIPHERTMTALAEARALGVEPAEVAKTVVLTTPSGFVRAVVPASEKLDFEKVRAALETKRVELLTEAALADAYPEFELGAVPPVGGSHEDRVIVDAGICDHEFVLLEAGTHEGSVRIASADLATHRSAIVVDICAD
jgi:Ala-tRNA(Pro) deacylase